MLANCLTFISTGTTSQTKNTCKSIAAPHRRSGEHDFATTFQLQQQGTTPTTIQHIPGNMLSLIVGVVGIALQQLLIEQQRRQRLFLDSENTSRRGFKPPSSQKKFILSLNTGAACLSHPRRRGVWTTVMASLSGPVRLCSTAPPRDRRELKRGVNNPSATAKMINVQL